MKLILLIVFICTVACIVNAQIGIGTTTPNSKLDVRGCLSTGLRFFTTNTVATATDNLRIFSGTAATTLRSMGNTANSDVVTNANNGTETANYLDMGINSSGFSNATYPVLDGYNNAYLCNTGGNFIIGNATAGKDLLFFAGDTIWPMNGFALPAMEMQGSVSRHPWKNWKLMVISGCQVLTDRYSSKRILIRTPA